MIEKADRFINEKFLTLKETGRENPKKLNSLREKNSWPMLNRKNCEGGSSKLKKCKNVTQAILHYGMYIMIENLF